jgi:dimethylargininase
MKTGERQFPTTAIVRDLPLSFFRALTMHAPSAPIDVDLARRQHDAYVEALRGLLPQVVKLPADESLPDCCFIEDTAVVIGRKAAISRLGAQERRGEERAVREALRAEGIETVDVDASATIDGGDVLWTGSHLVVGLSRRTNEAGAKALERIFGLPTWTVPVEGSLHLKSVLSGIDGETIVFGEGEAGRKIASELEERYGLGRNYRAEWVPDPVASNVLSLASTVVIQEGFPRSEAILSDLAARTGRTTIKLRMSELIKADGALTCCSLLF